MFHLEEAHRFLIDKVKGNAPIPRDAKRQMADEIAVSANDFERAEICEWKGNKNNSAALIAGHIMTARLVSGARNLEKTIHLVLAIAQATSADLRVLISLLLAQFDPKSNFAYVASIESKGSSGQGESTRWGQRTMDIRCPQMGKKHRRAFGVGACARDALRNNL